MQSQQSQARPSSRDNAQCRQLDPVEKERLFNIYVKPNLSTVKSLARQYTSRRQDIDANYNYCLAQLYHYIGSYNPSQKLTTWLHICVKRACFHEDQKRADEATHWTDMKMCTQDDLHQHGNNMSVEAGFGTLIDNISDRMYDALMQIPAERLSPFLLHVQGLRIREITASEWERGHLERRSEDLVKSRIYWARKQLQFILREYGITRKNNTCSSDD